MATTAKRPGKKTTARRKTAKKAATKKVAKSARRGAAGKKAQQRKPAPKRRPAAKAAAAKRGSTRSAASTKAAKKSKLAAVTKTARSRRKPVPAKKTTHRRMSPQARKNLVAKHLREMLDEKNRRAAQTPAWQQIVHHDHPAPMTAPRVADAVEAVPADERGPADTDDGNRDRGES